MSSEVYKLIAAVLRPLNVHFWKSPRLLYKKKIHNKVLSLKSRSFYVAANRNSLLSSRKSPRLQRNIYLITIRFPFGVSQVDFSSFHIQSKRIHMVLLGVAYDFDPIVFLL
ncbi:hypothetical protein NE237_013211 [Protea cynaroides]|uniref:Uncharacterized protein n=1 Tax=Protea cynaroides TaxID=273540 RepID=A0A9Q0GYW5_9MAGN|nr:hypothetical protein NE237_013211 [Protea cynaroides]